MIEKVSQLLNLIVTNHSTPPGPPTLGRPAERHRHLLNRQLPPPSRQPWVVRCLERALLSQRS